MPGTFTINTAATFATALLMGTAPRTKYGETEQDRTAAGQLRWDVQIAVTFLAEPGQRAVSEVLSVTVNADQDPGAAIPPGSPVELVDFRLGVSTAEVRQDGRGVRGGRPYFQASGLRSSPMPAHRKADAA